MCYLQATGTCLLSNGCLSDCLSALMKYHHKSCFYTRMIMKPCANPCQWRAGPTLLEGGLVTTWPFRQWHQAHPKLWAVWDKPCVLTALTSGLFMLMLPMGLPHEETFPFPSRPRGMSSGFPKLAFVSAQVYTVFCHLLSLPWSMSLMLLICCLERMDPVT